MKQLLGEQADTKGQLEEVEMDWLDAQEQLEAKKTEFEQQHVLS